MSKILIAAAPEPQEICKRILAGHELFFASKIVDGIHLLQTEHIDLIVSTILFDDSRMLDFLKAVKSNEECKTIPFVCLRVLSRKSDSGTVENVGVASTALGAAAFFNIDDFKNPERDMRASIEQFLDGGPKKKKVPVPR